MKTIYIFLISFILFGSGFAYAGPYTDSAHGDAANGVNRTSTSEYCTGNCAHCHEQHASIGGEEPEPKGSCPEPPCAEKYLLFSKNYTDQTNCFCFDCHTDIITSRQQSMIDQYSYSYKFGGETGLTCPDNIKEAFQFVTEAGVPQANCSVTTGSSHQLTDIRNFLKGKWGFDNTDAKVNPCSGCHNPHKAQRHNYPVGSKGSSPISRPSTHSDDWNVFGAETTERMNSYVYQSPYYYYTVSPTSYEPDGNSIADGSNLPDYVTFCTDCHDPIYNGSQMTSRQKSQFTTDVPVWIQNPDWNTSPHGNADGSEPDSMKRLDPYKADKNYVLSCTDCHETHGSTNRMLIRKEVNGQSTVTFTDWNSRSDWLTLCQRCHNISSGHHHDNPCRLCHTHDPNWHKPF